MLRQPRPAPKRHSARAQASASFCRRQGTPKAWEKSSAAGISSQPGRLGGERIRPLALSRGPPQLMPMEESSTSPA